MPNQPRTPNSKDAQEVDRLLRNLILEEESGPSATRPRPAPRPTPVPSPRGLSPLAIWGWAGLGAVLAGALTQWPYASCGFPLATYLVGVVLVLVTGVYAASAAWKARMAFAHILAIAVLFAGAALAAHQILTRVGYAAAQSSWSCPG